MTGRPGYDAYSPSVEQARRAAAEAGVADRVSYHVLDATLGLPEPVLRQLAGKAGFTQVRHVEMNNPFNRLYELGR